MTRARNSRQENSGHFDRAVRTEAYSPPADDKMSESITDVVCGIMDDDGPRPMSRLRPTKKTPTAAEQFHSEHQQPYEAYGARSRDRVRDVRAHNAACPRLRDELQRRRDDANVTMGSSRRSGVSKQGARNRCGTCSRSKKRACCKKRAPPRYERGFRLRRTSITKPKSRMATQPRFSRATSRRILGNHKKTMTMLEKGTLTCHEYKFTECKDNASQDSEATSKRKAPDTDASVSSYNSYASLEHEPMVDN